MPNYAMLALLSFLTLAYAVEFQISRKLTDTNTLNTIFPIHIHPNSKDEENFKQNESADKYIILTKF